MPFPLPFYPHAGYHPSRSHARYFGASRPRGRKHAGCDLLAPVGTSIFAIDDGVITAVSEHFYLETGMVAIRHSAGIVARYCEVEPKSMARWRPGMPVKSGDLIATVGKLHRSSMLHFELYSGRGNGQLSNRQNSPFQRRADLLNPTALLDNLKRDILISRGRVVVPNSTAQSVT
jgi:murein DD-endopeptidase MepM/ murein hydrolase activator NlpD